MSSRSLLRITPRCWPATTWPKTDGVPTVVETKRSSDPRARREVVAQMLDYAANGVVSWSAEAVRARFKARCAKSGLDPQDTFVSAMGDRDSDAFWVQVHTNLAARRLRLVFVADVIPPELETIVNFLNDQMQATEVLAIEVKQFVDDGGHHQTIVPRVLGQTPAARQAKGRSSGREWTQESILEQLEAKRGADEAAVAKRIFEWVADHEDLTLWYGRGSTDGSMIPVPRERHRRLLPFALYTYGRVEIQFQYLARQPPFDDERLREELRQRLNVIDGIDIPAEMLTVRPRVSLEVLARDGVLEDFLAVIDWAFAQTLPTHSASRT